MESSYAEFLGVEANQVVSVANCTLGLQGAASISSAESWLVPDFTFAATGLAVLQSGKRLLLGDVDETNWSLKTEHLHELKDDVGVMPVLPFGAAINLNNWQGRKHVIIDAAASLGAQPNLSSLPETWSVAFSLHATKVLPAGEGGLVVFGNAESAERFRMWTNFGFSDRRTSMYAGTNAKMSEIHAAYALASLEDWDAEREEWLCARDLATRACIESELPPRFAPSPGPNPYWIIDCGSAEFRQVLEKHLTVAGIGCRRWWPSALHEMPAFENREVVGSGSTSAHLSQRLLGLPMFRGLRTADVKRIVAVVSECL
jgi:dTDP-4-amino-4,6-dideoxygalactose transaminase